MGENEQQVFDGFAAEQGVAKYGLHRNAATAARYAKMTVIAVLFVGAAIFGAQMWNYMIEKEERLGRRSIQRLFFKAVAYERADHPDYAKTTERLMAYLYSNKNKNESVKYFSNRAEKLGAPITSNVLKSEAKLAEGELNLLLTTAKPKGKFWWSENRDFNALSKSEREEVRVLWQNNREVFKLLLEEAKNSKLSKL
jgi:hypothetical protein